MPRRVIELALALLALAVVGCGETPASQTPAASAPDPFATAPPPAPAPAQHEVLFSPLGGGFTSQQSVALATHSGQGTIHFTLDGSAPGPTSPTYDGPILLEQTTLLRAVVSGVTDPVPVSASLFVKLDSEVANFSSNLPLLVLERHGDRPIETDSDELRPASLLVYEPSSAGRVSLAGPAAASSRAGVRVRGQSSRGFPQKSYSLELWEGGSDDDRKASLLGMPPESDWVLVAPSEIDRSLMRTMLPMDLSRQIGAYAPRTRFVELFLVDREGSGSVQSADYLGVYTLGEKIKRDESRVNVAKAESPTEGGDLSGGFIFSIDHGEQNFDVHGQGFQWVYPEPEVMAEDARQAQVDYLRDFFGEFLDCLQEQNFTHSTSGKHYREYIDVEQWIDHNLLVALTKNVDGLRLSAYFHKDIAGPIAAGPIWDFDRSMGTPHDDRARRATEWASGDGTRPLEQGFWRDLFADPAFEAAYWARWDALRAGPFSVENITELIDGYEAQLLEARERHFERWQERPPEGSAAGEVQLLRDWFAERIPWLDQQRP
jgi:hypothetical protein